jgi:hypothetical protein
MIIFFSEHERFNEYSSFQCRCRVFKCRWLYFFQDNAHLRVEIQDIFINTYELELSICTEKVSYDTRLTKNDNHVLLSLFAMLIFTNSYSRMAALFNSNNFMIIFFSEHERFNEYSSFQCRCRVFKCRWLYFFQDNAHLLLLAGNKLKLK